MHKYSIVVSEYFGYYIKCIFKGLRNKRSFEKGVAFLKKLGYHGIELPLMIDIKDLIFGAKEIISSYEMGVSGIATGHYFSTMNYSLNNSNYVVRNKALNIAISGLSASYTLQAPLIIGLLRGKSFENKNSIPHVNFALKTLDKKARDVGVKVLLEPLNRYESGYVNTLVEAYDLINNLDLNNTGILADTFHMNIEEKNYSNSLQIVKDKIWHVHFADSNRWPPGCGHINFKKIITTLKNFGYNNWFAIECLPKPNAKDAAIESINFCKKIIK